MTKFYLKKVAPVAKQSFAIVSRTGETLVCHGPAQHEKILRKLEIGNRGANATFVSHRIGDSIVLHRFFLAPRQEKDGHLVDGTEKLYGYVVVIGPLGGERTLHNQVAFTDSEGQWQLL